MITVDALTVEFGGTTLFKDVSFQINPKDRIALMGKNGAGKSTLLKILAGVRTATRGSVSMPKRLRRGLPPPAPPYRRQAHRVRRNVPGVRPSP